MCRPASPARTPGRPILNRLVNPDHIIQDNRLRLFQAFPDRFVIGADEFIGPSGEQARIAASFDPTWAMLNQLPGPLAEKIDREKARQIHGLK